MKGIAKYLRKLADFLDPRVGPVEGVTIKIMADTEQFERSMETAKRHLKEFDALAIKAQRSLGKLPKPRRNDLKK